MTLFFPLNSAFIFYHLIFSFPLMEYVALYSESLFLGVGLAAHVLFVPWLHAALWEAWHFSSGRNPAWLTDKVRGWGSFGSPLMSSHPGIVGSMGNTTYSPGPQDFLVQCGVYVHVQPSVTWWHLGQKYDSGLRHSVEDSYGIVTTPAQLVWWHTDVLTTK